MRCDSIAANKVTDRCYYVYVSSHAYKVQLKFYSRWLLIIRHTERKRLCVCVHVYWRRAAASMFQSTFNWWIENTQKKEKNYVTTLHMLVIQNEFACVGFVVVTCVPNGRYTLLYTLHVNFVFCAHLFPNKNFFPLKLFYSIRYIVLQQLFYTSVKTYIRRN